MKYNVEKKSKKFYFGKQEDYSEYRPTYPIKFFEFLSKSLSYAPKEDSEYYDEFINGIITIFNKYKKDDIVHFNFHTEMFIGKI